MLVKLLVRWAIVAASLVAAVLLIPGITIEGNSAWFAVAVMAVILGFVNAIIRPILALISCGCIVATLGLFILVINAFTLWLSSWIANLLNIGFNVDGFWPAFWGGIVISVVSFLLSLLIPGDKESRHA
jgi:putative membrane protein